MPASVNSEIYFASPIDYGDATWPNDGGNRWGATVSIEDGSPAELPSVELHPAGGRNALRIFAGTGNNRRSQWEMQILYQEGQGYLEQAENTTPTVEFGEMAFAFRVRWEGTLAQAVHRVSEHGDSPQSGALQLQINHDPALPADANGERWRLYVRTANDPPGSQDRPTAVQIVRNTDYEIMVYRNTATDTIRLWARATGGGAWTAFSCTDHADDRGWRYTDLICRPKGGAGTANSCTWVTWCVHKAPFLYPGVDWSNPDEVWAVLGPDPYKWIYVGDATPTSFSVLVQSDPGLGLGAYVQIEHADNPEFIGSSLHPATPEQLPQGTTDDDIRHAKMFTVTGVTRGANDMYYARVLFRQTVGGAVAATGPIYAFRLPRAATAPPKKWSFVYLGCMAQGASAFSGLTFRAIRAIHQELAAAGEAIEFVHSEEDTIYADNSIGLGPAWTPLSYATQWHARFDDPFTAACLREMRLTLGKGDHERFNDQTARHMTGNTSPDGDASGALMRTFNNSFDTDPSDPWYDAVAGDVFEAAEEAYAAWAGDGQLGRMDSTHSTRSFINGRCKFIVLEGATEQRAATYGPAGLDYSGDQIPPGVGAPDNTTRTFYGPEQLAFFRAELESARPGSIICALLFGPVFDFRAGNDDYDFAAFRFERELFLHACKTAPPAGVKIILLVINRHTSYDSQRIRPALADSTWTTDAGDVIIREFCCGPAAQNGSYNRHVQEPEDPEAPQYTLQGLCEDPEVEAVRWQLHMGQVPETGLPRQDGTYRIVPVFTVDERRGTVRARFYNACDPATHAHTLMYDTGEIQAVSPIGRDDGAAGHRLLALGLLGGRR